MAGTIQHERTVFAISYRNPDPSMGGTTLDDYLIHGPREALDVIAEITGSPKIDIIGLCLGGALTAMLAAYLAEKGDVIVVDAGVALRQREQLTSLASVSNQALAIMADVLLHSDPQEREGRLAQVTRKYMPAMGVSVTTSIDEA